MKPPIKVQTVLDTVCRYYDFSEEELRTKSRKPKYVWPRQVFCHIAYGFCATNYRSIGNMVGLDHATTLYAVRKVSELCQTYKDLHQEVQDIKSQLRPSIPLVVVDVDLLELTKNYSGSFLKVG